MRVKGIVVGGDILYFESKKCCNADRLLLRLSKTFIFTAVQLRPPLPYDSVKSMVKLSHEPIMNGADTITLGFIATTGLRIVTISGVAFGQEVQLLMGRQCACMLVLLLMLKLSLGTTHELPAKYAKAVASSIHWQSDELAHLN